MPKSQNEILTLIIAVTCLLALITTFMALTIIVYNKRKRKMLLEKEIMQTQFQQVLLQTQIEIQSQTLKTISQEIHDNVGQVLSLAKLNLGTFEDTESVFNQTKINDTKQLVSKAINDLRDLSRSLYGNKIAELGLADAIDNELKILQNSGQFKTSFKKIGEPFKLDPQKEMVVYRMLQESLNNAIKHSKAQNIDVVLKYDTNLFTLAIADDGIGFDTANLQQSQQGMGFKSMQNRAGLIGGKLSITSFPEKGTTVSFTLQTGS